MSGLSSPIWIGNFHTRAQRAGLGIHDLIDGTHGSFKQIVNPGNEGEDSKVAR